MSSWYYQLCVEQKYSASHNQQQIKHVLFIYIDEMHIHNYGTVLSNRWHLWLLFFLFSTLQSIVLVLFHQCIEIDRERERSQTNYWLKYLWVESVVEKKRTNSWLVRCSIFTETMDGAHVKSFFTFAIVSVSSVVRPTIRYSFFFMTFMSLFLSLFVCLSVCLYVWVWVQGMWYNIPL